MPSQIIPAGATLATIAGGFGTTPSQLTLTPAWSTQAAQVAQTPNVTTVAFGVPAPPGGARLYWTQPSAQTNPAPMQGIATVPAGDISVTVFGSFCADAYQVAPTFSWFTDWTPEDIQAGEFTIMLSVPAPPGGGTMYWTVIPVPAPTESGQTSTLEDYLNELRRLLHDPLDQYWTVQDKVNDINRAMQRRDVDTGANRQLVPFALTIGKDTYAFGELGGFPCAPYAPILTPIGVSNFWLPTMDVSVERTRSFVVEFSVPAPPGGGALQWSVPLVSATGVVPPTSLSVAVPEGAVSVTVTAPEPPRIFDVVGINLVYIAQRVVLLNMSFTKLNVFKRPWTPYQGIVEAWARYGTSQVVFGPQPSLNYLTEWDVSIYSDPLVALTDVDPVPFPYTLRLVPMYAAYLAKINERQNDEAQQFLADYQREADVARNARVGLLPSAYGMTRV